MTLKCFYVEGNNDPEDAMIVFEETSIAAKRRWANEHGNGDRHIAGISALRRKHWDCHAPGPVPALEMIEEGWFFECHGCGTTISNDYIGNTERSDDGYSHSDYLMDREYGPDVTLDLPIMEPVELPGQRVYCTARCRDAHLLERRRIKTMEARALKLLTARLLKRYPGITVRSGGHLQPHFYIARDRGYLLIQQARVQVSFPGMRYGASFHSETDKWRQGQPKDGPMPRWSPSGHRLALSERWRDEAIFVANGDKEAWDAWRAAKEFA